MEGQTVSGRTKGKGRNAGKKAREWRLAKPALPFGMTLLGLALLPHTPDLIAQNPGQGTTSAGQAAPATPSANPSAPQAVPEASQTPNPAASTVPQVPPVVTNPLPALPVSVWSEAGANVAAIRFDGVTFADT